ncbi:MAG: hypothetical protein ACRDD1_16170, partial [Planctomycetia bacterium]
DRRRHDLRGRRRRALAAGLLLGGSAATVHFSTPPANWSLATAVTEAHTLWDVDFQREPRVSDFTGDWPRELEPSHCTGFVWCRFLDDSARVYELWNGRRRLVVVLTARRRYAEGSPVSFVSEGWYGARSVDPGPQVAAFESGASIVLVLAEQGADFEAFRRPIA